MDGYTGLMVSVPEALYKKFRVAVIEEDETVKGVILGFIKAYIEDSDNEKNIKNSQED